MEKWRNGGAMPFYMNLLSTCHWHSKFELLNSGSTVLSKVCFLMDRFMGKPLRIATGLTIKICLENIPIFKWLKWGSTFEHYCWQWHKKNVVKEQIFLIYKMNIFIVSIHFTSVHSRSIKCFFSLRSNLEYHYQ